MQAERHDSKLVESAAWHGKGGDRSVFGGEGHLLFGSSSSRSCCRVSACAGVQAVTPLAISRVAASGTSSRCPRVIRTRNFFRASMPRINRVREC